MIYLTKKLLLGLVFISVSNVYAQYNFFLMKNTFNGCTGENGDLVVSSGQLVQITEGKAYQYNSIRVDSGGELRIIGNSGDWTEICSKGPVEINGAIVARAGYDGQITHSGGDFYKQSSFGLGLLSYTITQANGGAGGAGGRAKGDGLTGSGGSGGLQSLGRGGGGGGGGYFDVKASSGGSGGAGGFSGSGASVYFSSFQGTYFVQGGAGGATLGNGGVGVVADFGVFGGPGGGGGGGGSGKGAGGGGGYKGHHGKGLVLYFESTVSGRAIIECGGRDGFNGAVGTDGVFYSIAHHQGAGGGGGGGAGGSGGKLIIKYAEGSLPSIIVSGGLGGLGGPRGLLAEENTAGNGGNGNSGTAGVVESSLLPIKDQ